MRISVLTNGYMEVNKRFNQQSLRLLYPWYMDQALGYLRSSAQPSRMQILLGFGR